MTARSNRLGVDPSKMAQPRAAEEQVPAVEPVATGAIVEHDVREPGAGGDTEDGHNHFGEIFTPGTCPGCAAMAKGPAPTDSPPTAPEPPPLATLISEIVDRAESVEALTREAHAAEAARVRAVEAHARAMSELAQRAFSDDVEMVQLGDTWFRPVPPRKVGGVVPEGAAWGLKSVRVAK